MASQLNIDKSKTALVVIDLQRGIASMTTEPRNAQTVINSAARLATVFRKSNMPVFLVRVAMAADHKDALQPITDAEPRKFQMGPDWSDIVPALSPLPADFVITKKQWGAFYGTELDLELRRRGMTTIVLCGIATNIGVESTARAAYELGYNQIFVEDAMSAMSKEEHDHSIKFILPRMGRVRLTEDVLAEVATLGML